MKKKATTNTKKAAPPAVVESVSQPVHEVPSDEAGLRASLAVLDDTSRPVGERLDALRAIQSASFGVLDFDNVRADYVASLRNAARDADHEMRQRALGFLSRENDAPTQKALIDGLRDPAKALVAPEKALQLLSYDPHGAYAAAREVVKQPPSEAAKREAVRILSSDPESAPMLEKLLANKKESVAVRRMSAAAVHAMNPAKLQNWAHKAVLDEAEHADIVATCLSAIESFGDEKAIGKNKALGARLEQLQGKSPAKVKQLAKQVKQKYGL